MQELNADVVIIAGGTAGLAAATTAAEKGARVVVLEKTGRTGGSGNMASGLFAVESRYQRNLQQAMTRDDIFKYFMEYTHWRVDARLVRTYINQSASTIDWLEKLGVEFIAVESHGVGNHYTWHIVKQAPGVKSMGSGITMMNILAERAKSLGTAIYLNTPATQIIRDGGKITGVIAKEESGKEIQVKTKAAIVATGGFGNNPEYIKKFTGFELGRDLFMNRIPGLDGDGLHMAWDIGAAETPMYMQLIQRGMMAGRAVMDAFLHPNLLVNLSGERFMNEDIVTGNNTYTGNAISLQKKKCAYHILDEDTKNYFMTHGFDFNTGYGVTGRPSCNPAEFDADIAAAREKGIEGICVAETLEELAVKCGIDPDGLNRTVAEFNRAAETGRDELFGRNPRYLRPVRQSKFYAMKFNLSSFGSLGGIRINYKTEVLDKELDIIPGLYAAGADAEAIYGETYTITLPGNTMGFAVNTGRMAALNAVEYIGSMT